MELTFGEHVPRADFQLLFYVLIKCHGWGRGKKTGLRELAGKVKKECARVHGFEEAEPGFKGSSSLKARSVLF